MILFTHTDSTVTLHFDGQANIAEYQTLLLSLTYTNAADEPMSGNRSISITVSDGIHQNMTAVIVVVVLRNDNILTLRAETLQYNYTEGDNGIALSGIVLFDEDRDAMIEQLVITLNGDLESDKESLVVDTSSILPGGGLTSRREVELTQVSSLQNYQVTLI